MSERKKEQFNVVEGMINGLSRELDDILDHLENLENEESSTLDWIEEIIPDLAKAVKNRDWDECNILIDRMASAIGGSVTHNAEVARFSVR